VRQYLTLVRFPNLLMVMLSQVLVQTCLLFPELPLPEALSGRFWLVVLSTVLVAAAGYIINDYYDVKIDAINKPHKIVIGKILTRRKAMLAHLFLSAAGVGLGAFLSLKVGLVNLVAVLLLWGYSADLKRRLLSGNLTIAFLAATMVLAVAVAFETYNLGVWAYVAFAFVSTLIREIIKDAEDLKGDAAHDCRTLPIVLGIPRIKPILYGLLVLFYALILGAAFYRQNNTLFGVYLGLAVLGPALLIGVMLHRADRRRHFARLSYWCKLVMFTGMLSMFFFRV
jgi:4-hydroxybenzoate polyprenyltransferase